MELRLQIKRIWRLPALIQQHSRAMSHFDCGEYADALRLYTKYEQLMVSLAAPLEPEVMLEKALCHQALEQDEDAVAYMDMLWQRLRDSTALNADEKAYLFLHYLKRAEPFMLAVKSIPPCFEKFDLQNVSSKLRRKYAIPDVVN